MKNKEVSWINTLKCFAIVSVVFAHCTYNDIFLGMIGSILGRIGVPLFLIIGGITFKNNKKIKDFIFAKFNRIILPWIIYGFLTYILYLVSSKSAFNINVMMKWILGYKTWLYYVPIYLCCIFASYFLSKYKLYIYSTILISIISNFLTSVGYLNYNYITSYQNPLNWIGFFTLGIYINNKYDILHKELILNKKTSIICFLISLICVVFQIIFIKEFNIKFSYWNLSSIIYEIIICYGIYRLSIKLHDISLINYIGKNTYAIYFLHMQIGINIFDLIFSNLLKYEFLIFLVKPIIIILIMAFLIKLVSLFFLKMKLNKLNNIFSLY